MDFDRSLNDVAHHRSAEVTNLAAENDSPFLHSEAHPHHVTDGAEPCGSTAI